MRNRRREDSRHEYPDGRLELPEDARERSPDWEAYGSRTLYDRPGRGRTPRGYSPSYVDYRDAYLHDAAYRSEQERPPEVYGDDEVPSREWERAAYASETEYSRRAAAQPHGPTPRGGLHPEDYTDRQSNYGGRDAGQTREDGDWAAAHAYREEERRREAARRGEPWSQSVLQAGQHLGPQVKRAFRGPKGYRRSDERIREDVCEQLGQHEELDASDVEVAVAGGEVTLSGTVKTRYEKFTAEEIADNVSGVTEVVNRLRVGREGTARESPGEPATSEQRGDTSGRSARA